MKNVKSDLRKKTKTIISVVPFLADGLLTVTLKGGMPQKYTGRFCQALIILFVLSVRIVPRGLSTESVTTCSVPSTILKT